MFPPESGVSVHCFTTWSLKGFISCNNETGVQKVIIFGNTCILSQKHLLIMFPR